jgi:Fe-S-cluster-containing dehydrogenase component/DMSO reductase anchor subunit
VTRSPLATQVAHERRRLPLLDQLLREQRELTAVERFAEHHANAKEPAQARYYRDLMPASPPGEGQQYAFRVDLDACTGCKACVTACHNLNGLDEGETWRAVGLLHGGTAAAPVQQSITTACHHCLDPACMNGCPVRAYEKDPVTGIVRHLDDQCIGCQYCTFTCPYDVPQFSAKLGIVRKCDMCSDRLAASEAPACVQGCPNEAIAITIVDKSQILEDAQADAPLVPGSPSPGLTAPTTQYQTARHLPRNLLPASFYVVKPAHAHTPLVVMLVLTQLSAGAFIVEALARGALAPAAARTLEPVHALVAMAVGLVALGASILHLGRPLYAFRALLGLRTSWMSREILAFGVFAPLAIGYAAVALAAGPIGAVVGDAVVTRTLEVLRVAVAGSGAVGVLCSVLIYHATRRATWTASIAGLKFAMTACILGLATTILTFAAGAAHVPLEARSTVDLVTAGLARALVAAVLLKSAGEAAFFAHLRDKQHTEARRAASLMTGDLARLTIGRFAALLFGGVVFPLGALTPPASAGGAAVSLGLLLVAELLERTLFFAAVSPPGMPRGID